MKRASTWMMILALVGLGLLAHPTTTYAQEFSFSSWSEANQQFDQLQAELASLRAQVASTDGDTSDDSGGCDSCGANDGSCSCYCDVCCGWSAGGEVVIAQPHFEDGLEEGEPGYDWEAAVRLWLGYRNCEGLGARVRWFVFDHASEVQSHGDDDDDDGDNTWNMDVETFDVEMTQLVCWGPLNADFSGGVRYAHSEQREPDGEGYLTHGFGPTIGIATHVPFRCSNLGWVTSLRTSYLFGEDKLMSYEEGDVEKDLKGFWIMESQVGLRYTASDCCGGNSLSFHALLEGQVWSAGGENPYGADDSNIDDDLSFVGIALGGTYNY